MPAVCHFSQFIIKFIFSEMPFAETVPELVLSRQGLISEKHILLFSFHGLAAHVHLGALFLVELHQIKDFLCQFLRLWWAALTQPDPSRGGTAEGSLYLPPFTLWPLGFSLQQWIHVQMLGGGAGVRFHHSSHRISHSHNYFLARKCQSGVRKPHAQVKPGQRNAPQKLPCSAALGIC